MIQILKSKFRNKTEISFSLLIILISSLLIIISLYTLAYYKYSISKKADTSIENRTLNIFIQNDLTEEQIYILENNDHITNIYENYTNWHLKYKENEFNPQNFNLSKITFSTELNNLKDNEAIISKQIANKYNLNIDDKIKFNKKYDITISAIVNEIKSHYIYFNYNTYKKLAIEENAILNKVLIVIDKYKNIDSIIENLTKYNIEAEKQETTNLEIKKMEEIITNINYGIYFIIFINIILIIFIFRYLIKAEYKNNALLKLLGYKNIHISYLIIIYLLLICLLTFFINLIIYLPLKFILDLLNIFTLTYKEYLIININISFLYIIISFISFIITTFKLNKSDALYIIEET